MHDRQSGKSALLTLFGILEVLSAICFFAAGTASATNAIVRTHIVVVEPGDTYEGIQYPAGTSVELNDVTGKVGYVFLGQDFVMNGHVIRKGTQLYVPDGRLDSYSALAGQKIGPIVLKGRDQVGFDREGRLAVIHLDHDTTILGTPYAAHTWVQFHPGGKRVAQGYLGRDVRRNGVMLAGGLPITFYPSGAVATARIRVGTHFGKLRFGNADYSTTVVTFWPNGKLKTAVLGQAAHVGGKSCAPGAIAFKESGALEQCVILEAPRQLAAEAARQKFAEMANANLLRESARVPSVVSLLAGSLDAADSRTDDEGPAARFDRPCSMAADRTGNLYVTECGLNHRVRRIGTNGVVTTVAGMAGDQGSGHKDGPASIARFLDPHGIAIDGQGNLFIADTGNHAVRKISPAGIVSTVVSGLEFPAELASDNAGNLYVANVSHDVLYRIARGGAVTKIAVVDHNWYSMDGALGTARFTSIGKPAFDGAGNLFVADKKLLRKISPARKVSTLGNYAESYVEMAPAITYNPDVLLIDPAGNLYFVVNSTIRRLAPDGSLAILAGVAKHDPDAPRGAGALDNPRGMVMLGLKTFAFISGNAVFRLELP